jgi:hypothetical protein
MFKAILQPLIRTMSLQVTGWVDTRKSAPFPRGPEEIRELIIIAFQIQTLIFVFWLLAK